MSAPERPKRSYQRRPVNGRRLVLNEFQADVVLSALRNEITKVRADRGTPDSLKMLAIRELQAVVEQMGEPVVTEVPQRV